jgi:hypothetical protein
VADRANGATRDPWILWLGQIATVATAAYLMLSALTFERGDALWFTFDVRWFYAASAVVGTLAAFWRRLRLPWLLMLLVCTLGRAAALVVIGSDTISTRVAELRGAFGWAVLWVLGSFPMFAAQASDIIRGRIEPRAR